MTHLLCLCRNFNSDYLSCDCRLRWVPGFFQSSSARLGDETLCAYPRSLKGKLLRGLKEGQLSCGESGGESDRRARRFATLLPKTLAYGRRR